MRPMKDNPCYGCVAPKRHPGCHSTCTDYIIAKAFHEVERDEDFKQREMIQYSIDLARKNRDNVVKRKRHFRGYKWPHD